MLDRQNTVKNATGLSYDSKTYYSGDEKESEAATENGKSKEN